MASKKKIPLGGPNFSGVHEKCTQNTLKRAWLALGWQRGTADTFKFRACPRLHPIVTILTIMEAALRLFTAFRGGENKLAIPTVHVFGHY